MEYVNGHFFTVEDLDDIDEHLALLNEQKTQLDQPDLDNSVSNNESIAETVISAIHSIDATKSTIEDIDLLIHRYGPLGIFMELKQMLLSRDSLSEQSQSLETGARIEQLLKTPALSLSDLESAFNESKTLSDLEIAAELADQLHGKVDIHRKKLSEELSTLLAEIKWLSPKESLSVDAGRFKHLTSLFSLLVRLQAISVGPPEYPAAWWALEVLTRPFRIRFDYHFNLNTDTNKMSRPEWALSFLESFLADNLPAFEALIGDTFVAYERVGVFELITALLVPVREKLVSMSNTFNSSILEAKNTSDSTVLEKYGRVLSHLIFETTSFDQRLRSVYKYTPFIENLQMAPKKKWLGLTGDILRGDDDSANDSTLAANWLDLEFRLASGRFEKDIISVESAFDIDFEFDASSANAAYSLKPTYSAYALVKLFDNLTSHFKTLSIVKYQLKYVSNIQLTFLDKYLKAVSGSFRECNKSLSSNIIGTFLPGSARHDTNSSVHDVINNGLKLLTHLTGLYCSLKFIVNSMTRWSEELVFVQLWNFYKSTSTNSIEEKSIFDGSISQYTDLLAKVGDKYDDFFRKQTRTTLRHYVNTCVWNIEDSATKDQPSELLSTFVTVATSYMSFLKRALPEPDYFIVASKMCDSFSMIFHEYIVTNNQFNKNGVLQLSTDFSYLERKLEDTLLLGTDSFFTNASNKNFQKVKQSIELLQALDSETAKNLRKSPTGAQEVRSLTPSIFDALSDRECNDLIFRIL